MVKLPMVGRGEGQSHELTRHTPQPGVSADARGSEETHVYSPPDLPSQQTQAERLLDFSPGRSIRVNLTEVNVPASARSAESEPSRPACLC